MDREIDELRAVTDDTAVTVNETNDRLSREKTVADQNLDSVTQSHQEKSELQQTIATLAVELNSQSTQIQENQRQKSLAKHQNQDLSQRLIAIDQALSSADADLKMYRDELARLETEIAGAQEKALVIESEMSSLDSDRSEEQIRQLTLSIESCHSEIEVAVETQEKLTHRLSKCGLAGQPSTLASVQERFKETTSLEMKGSMEREALGRQRVDFERQFVERQAEFSEMMQAVNREKTATMERRSVLTAKVADFQHETAALEAEMRELTSVVHDIVAGLELVKRRQIAAKQPLNKSRILKVD
jgi:chromosome segregation ATPase